MSSTNLHEKQRMFKYVCMVILGVLSGGTLIKLDSPQMDGGCEIRPSGIIRADAAKAVTQAAVASGQGQPRTTSMRHMTASTRLQSQPQAVAARAGQQKRPGAAAWQLQREGTAVSNLWLVAAMAQAILVSSSSKEKKKKVAVAVGKQPCDSQQQTQSRLQGPGCAIAAATAVQEQRSSKGTTRRSRAARQVAAGVSNQCRCALGQQRCSKMHWASAAWDLDP
ncbi:hypothetical protein Acr_00g0051280 [Actinidia rufa]|uniref:Uncharacterized protein n=1 Tax=Actinidia rufa TaxID=165716 RepID=A0A7J0DLE4_9ERIC|nr:hypothetical protein Acr_00g0051280 [Actinidia rufa]